MATLRTLALLVLLALSSSTASARLLHSLGEGGGLAATRAGTADTDTSPEPPVATDATEPPLDPPTGSDASPANDPPLLVRQTAPEEDQPAGDDDSDVPPEQQARRQEAEPEELATSPEDVAEAEQEHVDVSAVGVPAADLTTAAAFPEAAADGEVAATFDVPEAEDDAAFTQAAVGCHPVPKHVEAYWADYDLYPPYTPKLKCPHGWHAATSKSDKQVVKDLLDDAFYRMVLPAIDLDHSKRARAFKCQPVDVVSLHHHNIAGCIDPHSDRMIVQGDMEYECWGSHKPRTVGQKVKGDAW